MKFLILYWEQFSWAYEENTEWMIDISLVIVQDSRKFSRCKKLERVMML